MKQFDVFAMEDVGGVVAVVVMAGEYYLDLPNILVVPLYPIDFPARVTQINPVLELDTKPYIAVVDEAVAVPVGLLARKIGSLASQYTLLTNALDRLIAGY
jgi:hypothetical protein